MNSHILSKALERVFLYLRSCTRAGTKTMDITNVIAIPRTKVVPTVLIGSMGTRLGHLRTLKPMIVVNADRKMACPVVSTALTVAVRLM